MLKIMRALLMSVAAVLVAVIAFEFWLLRMPLPEVVVKSPIPAGAIYVDGRNELPRAGALVVWDAELAAEQCVSYIKSLREGTDTPLCIRVSDAGLVESIGFVPETLSAGGCTIIARGVRAVDVSPERVAVGDRLDSVAGERQWLVHVADVVKRQSEAQVRIEDLRGHLSTAVSDMGSTVVAVFSKQVLARLVDLEKRLGGCDTVEKVSDLRRELDEEAVGCELALLGERAFLAQEIRAVLLRSEDKDGSAESARLQGLIKAGFNTLVIEAFRWGGAVNPQGKQGLWHSQPLGLTAAPVTDYSMLARQFGVDMWVWVQNGFLSAGKIAPELVPAEQLVRTADGGVLADDGNQWLCLRQPAVRKMLIEAYMELVDTADAKCVAMDYMYGQIDSPSLKNTNGLCRCEVCRAVVADVALEGAALHREQYAGQTAMLRELRAALDARKGGGRVAIAVFCHADQSGFSSNMPVLEWIDAGLVDWICPMSYAPVSAQRSTVAALLKDERVRSRLLPGCGLHSQAVALKPAEYARQVVTARQEGLAGYQFFQAGLVSAELGGVLARTVNAMGAAGRAVDMPTAARADERRSTWLIGKTLYESTQTLAARLDGLAAMGMTDVMLNCWYRGYTAYPDSKVAEMDPELAKLGRVDVYGDAVRAIRERGMRCVAWLEYGLFSGHDKEAGEKARARQVFMSKHKELLSVDSSGNPDNTIANYGTFFTLCPANPASYELIAQIALEVAGRYEVDEIQLDRMKFADDKRCFCDYCKKNYKQDTGRELNEGEIGKSDFVSWKREKNANGLKIVHDLLKAKHPGLALSSYVTWPAEMNLVAQSWDLWLSRGYVDRLTVGAYVDFDGTVRDTRRLAGEHFSKVDFAIHAEQCTPERVLRQVEKLRSGGVGGWSLWPAESAMRLVPFFAF